MVAVTWVSSKGFDFNSGTGDLICLKCNKAWCEHVQSALMSNADTLYFFPTISDANKEVQVRVPMWPRWELWKTVILEPVSSTAYMAKASLGDIPDYKLGFFSEGEGRLILRGMLTDWLKSYINELNYKCRSSSHDMEAEKIWTANTARSSNKSAAYWAQHWAVYEEGLCLTCFSRVRAIASAIPDFS